MFTVYHLLTSRSETKENYSAFPLLPPSILASKYDYQDLPQTDNQPQFSYCDDQEYLFVLDIKRWRVFQLPSNYTIYWPQCPQTEQPLSLMGWQTVVDTGHHSLHL